MDHPWLPGPDAKERKEEAERGVQQSRKRVDMKRVRVYGFEMMSQGKCQGARSVKNARRATMTMKWGGRFFSSNAALH